MTRKTTRKLTSSNGLCHQDNPTMLTGYSFVTVGDLMQDLTLSPFSRGRTWEQKRSLAFVHAKLRGEPSQSLTFVNHPDRDSCDQDPYLLDGHARLGALLAVARETSSIAAEVRDIVMVCEFVTIPADTWAETTERLRRTLNSKTVNYWSGREPRREGRSSRYVGSWHGCGPGGRGRGN